MTSTKPSTASATRGAVTDQQGRVLSSSNPARIGQYYTMWMSLRGPFDKSNKPVNALRLKLWDVPTYNYTGDKVSTVFYGQEKHYPADLSYVGPSQFPGL